MYDETQRKIIDATMNLIIEKGYSGATTKNIALLAGVNECTIFRRFRGKKEIVLAALELPQWNPGLKKEDFVYQGELLDDLLSFARIYTAKVTPRMVKISIGIRAAELEDVALSGIMQVPALFKGVLIEYFSMMQEKGLIRNVDIESTALQFLSMNFGFVFLDASFGEQLIGVSKEEYIRNSVEIFAGGISEKL
ncbi:MAG: TetR/AcrR family transcriptional regulator [Acetatifactor sp.]